MTLNICEKINQTIGGLFACSPVNEFVQISTPFILPDGSVIDLFLKEKEESYVLTDLGETFGWLYLQTAAYSLSKNQEIIIKDIVITHGIEQFNGMLITRLKKDDNLADAVLRLSQAIIRVADTNTKLKVPTFEPITEEVTEFLNKKNLNVERNKKFRGMSGTDRTVDFCVYRPNGNTLINTLSTPLRRTARMRVDKVFTTWSEISDLKESNYNFISLIDDSTDLWNENNITLLNLVSNVVKWSNRDELQKFLE
ncbi:MULTISPECIES: DUF1828 domain-containing protein [Nostocales]|jgi:hypothetical protein|uniref:DUF1828 domain-containing protein n=2 Tax=Aphanizomenonaceae TaxID=1892259 RepID=A0ACC7S9K4_DOLFA|nr:MULTISPECIES: DUF1828 domain-containing protein [Nostocales]MBO1045904.1 DUF1828 domain-containing protein [Aphanizomenon flos-aquae UKL13-PB]MBO1062507.1 DUF1828 domain-containing protein [Aphanizomenon flos-aquae CP01]MCX5983403.1 DUF1828 domain-containing protein [Nostocales cyanobacterium LacPavin_0920_SED1_MAG_38_18]OBQ26599.1 MAG: hypothetical protein AN481_04140 [Aphanizomenon flos-aquae LD13]HCQ23212.1 DUF1828 domain-containing protein [Anabaena sp. UBA12330]